MTHQSSAFAKSAVPKEDRSRRPRTALRWLEQRRRLTISLTGIVAFAVTAGLSVRRGVPFAAIHDEFSYLLAADTFAHGRVTNPPHPLWEHFESMHILVQPSYMSKYPPAQGLALAAGQALVGHPAWGVWLTTGLGAAAICWMLMPFVPMRWALLGGILVAVHPQIVSWGQSYWGGNLGVLGGAMVLGGFARLVRRRDARPAAAVWMAIGMLVLANSRPYEGLLLCGILTLGLLAGRRWPRLFPVFRLSLGSIALPVAAVLVPAAIVMAYFNWRVTGHPLRLPYREHQAQYAVVPLFWLLPMREPPPVYRHKELKRFYTREQARWYNRRDAWQQFKSIMHQKWSLHEGSAAPIGITILMLPTLLRRNRHSRLLIFVLVMYMLGLLAETFMFPHYAAPCVSVIVALGLIALRRLAHLSRPIGPVVVATVTALYFASSLLWWIEFFTSPQVGFAVARHQVSTDLAARPGKHLVIVRYGEEHNLHEEWVYNHADIDAARVVWARELDAKHNRRLIDYFEDRTPWLLEPDTDPTRLRPYPK